MRHATISCFSAALLSMLSACGSPATKPLDQPGAARLEALRTAPETAGRLIYEGFVHALGGSPASQLYSYQRRVGEIPEGLTSSHITRTPIGDVILVESAQFTNNYDLLGFEATNKQAGYSGSVVVIDGQRMEYVLNESGKVTTASEKVNQPVVSGPSLHGFILKHWDELLKGRAIPVRFIALAEKKTYGFDIRLSEVADGHTSFSVTPSNFLVRLALDPLTVEFDSSSRNVTRYVGRVPPKQEIDGKLKPLDARVDYTMKVAHYR
ncbi:MAG: hypothetical protein ABL878_13590 [Burkholderiales bacterium]